MTNLNIYLSGHVRTLYECFPKTLQCIRDSNPNIDISVYYSFWKSTDRLLDRKAVTGHADSVWATKGKKHLTADMTQQKNLNQFFGSLGVTVKESKTIDESVMHAVLKATPFKNENKNNVSKLSSQYFQIYEAAQLHKNIPDDDFCLRLRSDITIEHFPNLAKIGESLIVNEFIWEDYRYSGSTCNEMIWLCKGKYFFDTCSLYLDEASFAGYGYGENVMGHYFLDLQRKKKITQIEPFNFKYRILR